MSFVDFHCHTNASDGKLTPTQLVQKAKKLGILYLAKTDHDNVDLTEEFMDAGKKYGVNTIAGIEISSRYKGKSVHIVGLGIDWKNKEIKEYAKKCTMARRERGLKMAKKLERAGFKIKKSEIDRKVIVRPHVARAVIEHSGNRERLLKEFGKTPSFSEFITKYMAKGGPCYARKTFYALAKPAVRMVHGAGGLAIVAHPMSKTSEFSYSRIHLDQLLKFNFDGIEVYNPDNTEEEIKYLLKLSQKNKLLISAGSDYHGIDREYKLGICKLGKKAREKDCQELIEKLS